MIDFLAVVLIGACTGLAVAIESRLAVQPGRRWRGFWTWSHTVACWPLPLLISFHVLSTYYF
jgi:nitrite reductase (NADH) large subunit